MRLLHAHGRHKPLFTCLVSGNKFCPRICCVIDHGAFYAAKDMEDPVHGRRIYWGWNAYIAPAQGGLSLPRELTW